MRKIISAINMTPDGICDHTSIVPDAKIHHYYTESISNSGVLLKATDEDLPLSEKIQKLKPD